MAAGGENKNDGKPGVVHTAPVDTVAGAGGAETGQTFFLDGKEIDIRDGETIFRAGRRNDIRLPHLCYINKPGYRPDGNCRVCMVEIEGERVLAASCLRKPAPGMKVKTPTDRAKNARRMVAELLLTDQPLLEEAHDPHTELTGIFRRLKLERGRFEPRPAPAPDRSHPAMAVNLDACIHCNLCVRACREVQVNDVIGMAGRGHNEKIVFDFDDPMGDSTCVACGECVQACPTGALMPATLVDDNNVLHQRVPDRAVNSVCPYCGVGCQLTYHIKDDKLLSVTGRNGPANQNRLCVKGRFGFDYVSNPQRLTQPLVRKDGVGKAADDLVDPANPWTHFRAATWDEAMERAASGLVKIRDRDGPRALAGFGSAKGSNEEAYLFQKLVRTGFGTNNVDHCTRLCHASSVAALLEGVGSAAVTATFNECKNSDVIVVIGANPTENHPVAATFFKQAAKRGAKLIVMDPRGQALKRHAWQMMQFKNGTDVAMLNGMLNVIIGEKLYDQQYVQTYTEDFDKLAESVKPFTPEEMAPICGIEADVLRNVARTFARAESAIIFWGMGVSQHTHGTDNARCLIALSLICGQVGRPGTGPASAARPEQRAGRLRRRPHPDVLPRLQVGGGRRDPRQIRSRLGRDARSQEGQDRGRDHGRGARRRDQGHVHHGREPRDVRPRPQPRARRAGASRASRGAGHLPHRDRVLCRRHPAGLGLAGEGRHRHQHQSPGADGPPGAAAAGRGAAGSVDHPGSRPAHGLQVELPARQRGVHRDGLADAGARQHFVGPRRARRSRHLSGRRAGRAGPRRGVRQGLPAARAASPSWWRRNTRRRTKCRMPNSPSSSPPAASSSTGTPAR